MSATKRVAVRIERHAAWSVEHTGPEQGLHGCGRGARRTLAYGALHRLTRAGHRSSGEDEPGEGHGRSAHDHIMPVAAATGLGDRP